jgi:hypothetical protein
MTRSCITCGLPTRRRLTVGHVCYDLCAGIGTRPAGMS